jgi:hypothetical protein
VVEEVLAVRLGAFQDAPVEHLGAGGEAALRAAERDRVAAVAASMQTGEAVQGVAFGHAADDPS